MVGMISEADIATQRSEDRVMEVVDRVYGAPSTS
jgi:hypothetical protein